MGKEIFIKNFEIETFEDPKIEKMSFHRKSEWDEINTQILRSGIKRFNWKELLSESLTKRILRVKFEGYDQEEAIKILLNEPHIREFIKEQPHNQEDIEKNIRISVYARYGENNSLNKLQDEIWQKNVLNVEQN